MNFVYANEDQMQVFVNKDGMKIKADMNVKD